MSTFLLQVFLSNIIIYSFLIITAGIIFRKEVIKLWNEFKLDKAIKKLNKFQRTLR